MAWLWVQFEFPGLNDVIKKHWRAYEQAKKDHSLLVAGAARRTGLPVGEMEPCHATFLHVLKDRRRDPDNVTAFAQKVVLDAVLGARRDGQRYVLGLSHFWEVAKPQGVLVCFCAERTMNKGEMVTAYEQERI